MEIKREGNRGLEADIREILSLLGADIVHRVLEFPPLRFFQGVEIVCGSNQRVLS